MAPFCQDCSLFSFLFNPSLFRPKNRKLVRRLPDPPRCDICKFLSALIASHHLPDGVSGFPIFIYPLRKAANDALLVDIQLGRMDEADNELFSVNFEDDRWGAPNYPLIRSWINNCKDHHSESCRMSADVEIPDITLLNVQTRQLVTLPFCPSTSDAYTPYIALSYVWGKADNKAGNKGSALKAFTYPRLIEDVITVAKNLGYDFIWVDRYCIPSDNHIKRTAQIANMGHIYRNSDLTIIASRGLDPSYGLNGVSEPREQPRRLGDLNVYPAHSAVRAEVLESEWNSRGWTYQEAILSRRLLVFTSSQCYFQCNAAHQLEHYPTEPDKIIDIPPIFDLMGSSSGSEKPLDHSLLDVFIAEFCSRNLTFEADRFNAIKGVLDNFERRASSLRMFQGIPLVTGAGLSDSTTMFTLGLSWYPKATTPITRVQYFPSWTWLGWKLESGRRALKRTESGFHLDSIYLTWKQEYNQAPRPIKHSSLVEISLMKEGRFECSWEAAMSDNLNTVPSGLKTALRLNGWRISIDVNPNASEWNQGPICFRKRDFMETKKGQNQVTTGILVHASLKLITPETSFVELGSTLGFCYKDFRETCPAEKEHTLVVVGIMLVERVKTKAAQSKESLAEAKIHTRCGWIEAAFIKEMLPNPFQFEDYPNLGSSLVSLFKEAGCIQEFEKVEAMVE